MDALLKKKLGEVLNFADPDGRIGVYRVVATGREYYPLEGGRDVRECSLERVCDGPMTDAEIAARFQQEGNNAESQQ